MEWLDLLQQVFEVCVIPLLGVLTTFLVKFIKAKQKEAEEKNKQDNLDKYIALLGETIADCVAATTQTYVEAMKNEQVFDKEAQKKALDDTCDAVIKILSDDAKDALNLAYSDLQMIVKQKIEAEVKKQKS
jgi:hypothetical protein